MARPPKCAREIGIQGLRPVGISIDPEVEDEIAMCKLGSEKVVVKEPSKLWYISLLV
jgi:hypothetical protein